MPSLLTYFQANGCLVKDLFPTAFAAGALNGKTRGCEPGPSGLKFTDPNSKVSITASGLVLASPVASYEYSVVKGNPITRASGLALLWTETALGTFILVGFSNAATVTTTSVIYGNQLNSGLNVFFRESNTSTSAALTSVSAGAHTYAIVLKSTGALFIVDGNLHFVSDADSTASLYPAITAQLAGTPSGTIPKFVTAQLTGGWASDYGMATNRIAITSAGSTTTSTADGFIQHTITAATGVTQDLMVRRTDDNNCWIVRCNQTAATIALIEKNAGVETSRASAAFTWTNGAAYRIACRMIGTEMKVFVVQSGAANNSVSDKITFTIGNSFNLTATGIKVVTSAGTNLVCWPYAVSLPTL